MSAKNEGATIKGHVYDEKGRAVGGVRITLDGSETTTLFDGSYSFRCASTGPHKLEVAVEGYRNTTRSIDVKEGELVKVDFFMEPEIGEGMVYGHVIDHDSGEPVKHGGAVYMSNSIYIRSAPIRPITGYYEFANLPKGTYDIWVSALDYDDEKKTLTIEKDEKQRVDFHIRRKEPEPLWG